MHRVSTYSDKKWGSGFTRLTVAALCVVVIVWFLPRTEGPQYNYDIGKPWMYGSLIAQFDFAVLKSDEAVEAERDSMLALFEPYYNYVSATESEQLVLFLNRYEGGMPDLPAEYTDIIAARLRHVYSLGIMSTDDYSRISADTAARIRIVNDKIATSTATGDILSERAAYEMLFTGDINGQERQALQKCNLNEYIVPNLVYDEERNEEETNDIIASIPTASGVVLSGQRIIDRGEIVDDYLYRVLNSLEREMSRRSANASTISSTIAGQALFVAVLITLFTLYLALFRKDYFDKTRSIAMLYVLITVFPVLVSVMMDNMILNVYILPFAITPIFVRVFMDSRTAFITHTVMILICAAAVKYQYEFIIIQLVAGMVAVYSLRELSQRAQLYRTALLVAVASSVMYFALQLMQDNDISTMDHSMYKYFVVNGIFLLFAYPLMLVVEKTFGFISNVTLIELSNTSKELLRKLSEVAPGTFQHSIMVANLAAEVANKIGAKAQLVRTGAMYHDIGKMYNPAFFTENQADKNPLADMPRPDAARIVINHVAEGLKLAEKYNLPNVIKNFIATHHGAGKAKFFYISYLNEHPGETVDESLFSYPGPDPFTCEQAILMMADSVEAASRSLPEYTEQSIGNMVDRIVNGQMKEGFFNNCPITFHEIDVAKQVFIERLKTTYHTRITYPELK